MKLSHTRHRHEFVYFIDTIHFSHLEVFRFIFIPSLLFNIFFFLSVCLSVFLSSFLSLSLSLFLSFLLWPFSTRRRWVFVAPDHIQREHTPTQTHPHTHTPKPNHTHTHTNNEWLALRRDLYLTTHNTHKRERSMPPGEIRTRNPKKRAAADPSLRPDGHRNWLSL